MVNKKNFSKEESSLLTRIDERTLLMAKQLEEINSRLKTEYVSHTEFSPIKNIVYGMVSVILVSVLGGILGLIFL